MMMILTDSKFEGEIKMNSKMKIGARLVITVSLLLIFAIAAITITVSLQIQMLSSNNARTIAEETGEHYANLIKADIEVAMDEARALANVFESLVNTDGVSMDRNEANMILKYFIEENTNFLGVYVLFEPDAFDGIDEEFAGTSGHDNTGRLIPYWTRGEDGIGVIEALADYEAEGGYYTIPRKKNRETVIDPYIYPIQGVDVLLTSLVVPIQDSNNRFIGISGIDLGLSELQDLIEEIQLADYEGAHIEFISEAGILVASQTGEGIGSLHYDSKILEILKSGSISTEETFDASSGEPMLSTIVPVKIGNSGQNWFVVVHIPESEMYASMRRSIILVIIIGIGVLLISIIVIFFVARSISNPIKDITLGAKWLSVGDIEMKSMDHTRITSINLRGDELGDIGRAFTDLIAYQATKVELAEKMASGDLRVDIEVSSEEDTLGIAFSKMTVSLNNLLGQINMSVDQVNIGADQVSQASQSLSQGATESASSLEEVSASVTQINSQSRQNAENATEANGIAKKAAEDAEKGNKQMAALSDAMEKINVSSDQIKKIVKVIDDIAFQTNLLALNANVEAARAGKYGKGFAVVADEVRNLAVRSAEAVKETTDMVDDSIKNIVSGNKAVEATATQLEAIMGGASKVADFLEEIATASKEQAEAIDQITKGLEQIDQVTQSNTASAEESAAAAEELASQSIQLKNMVATFKLKKSQNNSVPQPRQLEDQAQKVSAHIEHRVSNQAETGIKPVDPASVISLDDDDFDRF
jgi:methyl-accepting chemotaxis protein